MSLAFWVQQFDPLIRAAGAEPVMYQIWPLASQRYNAEAGREENRLNLAAVRRDLASIRADGYVPSFDRVTQGAGGISVLLPVAPHGVPMAVAIGGLSRTINDNRERFLQLIRKSIRRHVQPAPGELRAA